MKDIKQIIDEINEENGSNYKLEVLKKYKDNETLTNVLELTYDKVKFTWGVSVGTVTLPELHFGNMTLETSFVLLDQLNRREVTGNLAREKIQAVLEALSERDALVFYNILRRDQRINTGRSTINKVHKNLITKPPYSRCSIGDKKNLQKLNFKEGVFSQLKMDGTYRSYQDGQFTSRSGQEQPFPILEEALKNFPVDYVLLGELTLRGAKDRQKGNGLINSDTPPHEDVIFTVWDMVHVSEYKEKNGTTLYRDRFQMLNDTIKAIKNVEVVETKEVHSVKEAYDHFQEMQARGLEGTVVKSKEMKWKDGNSKEQLKVKLQFTVDVRITGFIEGTPDSKRAATFGSLTYTTDDGKIQGSVSGFNDETLEDFNSRREEMIGQIMEVEANDLTKSTGNEFYALSHPRFKTLRDPKETDTLKRVQESIEMAKELS